MGRLRKNPATHTRLRVFPGATPLRRGAIQLSLCEPAKRSTPNSTIGQPTSAAQPFLLYSEHQPFGLIAPSTTVQLPGA